MAAAGNGLCPAGEGKPSDIFWFGWAGDGLKGVRDAPHGGADGALPLVALGAPPVAAAGNGLCPAGEGMPSGIFWFGWAGDGLKGAWNAPHGGASGVLPLVALAAAGNGLCPAGEGKTLGTFWFGWAGDGLKRAWNAAHGGASGALPLVALGAALVAATGNARFASLLGGAALVVSFGLCSDFFLL